MNCRRRASGYDKATVRTPRERRDGALNLVGTAHIDGTQFYPKRRPHGLDRCELGGSTGYGRISKDCHAHHARRNLFEEFQPFPAEGIFEVAKAGDITTRPRHALD